MWSSTPLKFPQAGALHWNLWVRSTASLDRGKGKVIVTDIEHLEYFATASWYKVTCSWTGLKAEVKWGSDCNCGRCSGVKTLVSYRQHRIGENGKTLFFSWSIPALVAVFLLHLFAICLFLSFVAFGQFGGQGISNLNCALSVEWKVGLWLLMLILMLIFVTLRYEVNSCTSSRVIMTKLYEERLSASHPIGFLSLLRCIAVHFVEDPMATISLCGNGPSQCVLEGAVCSKHSIQYKFAVRSIHEEILYIPLYKLQEWLRMNHDVTWQIIQSWVMSHDWHWLTKPQAGVRISDERISPCITGPNSCTEWALDLGNAGLAQWQWLAVLSYVTTTGSNGKLVESFPWNLNWFLNGFDGVLATTQAKEMRMAIMTAIMRGGDPKEC